MKLWQGLQLVQLYYKNLSYWISFSKQWIKKLAQQNKIRKSCQLLCCRTQIWYHDNLLCFIIHKYFTYIDIQYTFINTYHKIEGRPPAAPPFWPLYLIICIMYMYYNIYVLLYVFVICIIKNTIYILNIYMYICFFNFSFFS